MSKQGLLVAQQYGSKLPAFYSILEAERILFSLRDTTLETFMREYGQRLRLDYTAESLKTLEKWCLQGSHQESENRSFQLPLAVGFYYGEVYCRNNNFEWFVQEYVFQPGRYQIGVRQSGLSIMLTTGQFPRIENNKRMQSLWREYLKYTQ